MSIVEMTQWSCPKGCGKVFAQKSHLTVHTSRKTPCVKNQSTLQSEEVEDIKPYIDAIEQAIANYKGVLERNRQRELKTNLNPVVHVPEQPAVLNRLNYIGCKSQLIEWIHQTMLEKTGYDSLNNIRVADLFAGTGVVTYFFRQQKAHVITNDKEPYSAMIAAASATSTLTPNLNTILLDVNAELAANKHKDTVGYITQQYSPFNGCERMFFTVDNAQRIDYCRERFKNLTLTDQERTFLWGSLLWSADAVSNVPAVYGCYLKNFKAKALHAMTLKPIHTNTRSAHPNSEAYQESVTSEDFLKKINADIVYLDPPYNERQYSKNYFPLNMILNPSEHPLKGKTGIPQECFLSPFCMAKSVEASFKTIVKGLKTTWIFISYNSESLVPKEKMLKILGEVGEVSVVEKPYKRFKSFEYNEDKAITEYLYCVRKNTSIVPPS